MDTSRTTGEMSAVRKMDGRSPPPTPPGTAPALAGSAVEIAATGAASGGARVAAGGEALAVTRPADPGTGVASGMSNGASVGPPELTAIVTALSASAWVSRFVGYAVRRPEVVAERSAPSTPATVTPEAWTTISRQPSRSWFDVSAYVR